VLFAVKVLSRSALSLRGNRHADSERLAVLSEHRVYK
jgi:hypothetical protein